LIVGGGDGGSAEELLKYQTIESVTLVEIDIAVLDIARKYFSAVHHGALLDPRVSVKVEDGFAFVRATSDSYDLIVLDLTDPGGASEPLYGVEFYRACAARLNPTGAMALHVASPVAHPDRIRTAMANLRAVFSVVIPYLVSIPLYGGLWMMACASPTLNPAYLTPLEANRRIATRGIGDLRYYNGEIHRASMALPNFVRELVA
jgi:spermidine synthase